MKTLIRRMFGLVLVATYWSVASASADTIAYNVPFGTAGNQAFGGSLGMDFDVAGDPILVTNLGVFDDLSNGLNLDITGWIADRNTTLPVIGQFVFNTANSTLAPGSGYRFLNTFVPVILPAGFQGRIIASGYGTGELNGNAGGSNFPTLDTGGGLISFVGVSTFGFVAGTYPTNNDASVAQYGAGSFQFSSVPPPLVIPEPSTIMLLGLGVAGLAWRVRRKK